MSNAMTKVIGLRVSDDVLQAVDEYAAREGRTRSGAILYLIGLGLNLGAAAKANNKDAEAAKPKAARTQAQPQEPVKPCRHGLAFHPGCNA